MSARPEPRWVKCERCGGCGGRFDATFIEGGCGACEGTGIVLDDGHNGGSARQQGGDGAD